MTQGISVALLRPLAELLGRLDADPAEFLASLGVDAEATPATYVDGAEVDRRLEAVAARRGDPTFGLTLARTAVAWPLGIFGHLIWTSGTVRDALARAVRFYGMVTRRTTLTLEESGARAILRQHGVPGIARGAILTEYPFASLALRARAATEARFAVRAVRFTHAQPAALAARYHEVFGVAVAFGAGADELELDTAQLDLRLASADPITSAVLETTVAALTETPSRSPFLDRVRRAAAMHLGEAISLELLARELGTSPRTLRRHLEQESSSLRAVVDELRRERADALLAAGTPIKEIAFGLGFSEPSAFSRAYKRWTGKAPT
jgi:AraC-like DNA-binding protein